MAPAPASAVVLITGAASGIGLATARACAARGASIIACDINADGLAELRAELGTRLLLAEQVDVADRAAMAAFADHVHALVPAVDILVNNAGVALSATFLETPLSDWDWVVGINLMGVVHGCHFFVPPMVARNAARASAMRSSRARAGYVVNVSSMMGFIAFRQLGAYAATKFAVFGLSEALRGELAPHGIGVATICPGMIATSIVKGSRARGKLADDLAANDAFWQKRGVPPERVAAAIVDAVDQGRTVVPVAAEAVAFWGLKRLAPDLAVRLLDGLARAREALRRRGSRGKSAPAL